MPPARWRALQILSLLVVALSLVPTGAHLFALPNKIGLPPAEYLVTQAAYRGWALFGIVTIPALLLVGLHTFALRDRLGVFMLSLVALVTLVLSNALFWAYTQPANRATAFWTRVPSDFERLRAQWEYSHAAAAVLTFVAFVSLLFAIVNETPRPVLPGDRDEKSER
jgi:hypothetical protein